MKIEKKDLPLSAERLKEVTSFCSNATNLRSLTKVGSIPDILRREYLDESLPFPDRAIRNVKMHPDLWRGSLNIACHKVVEDEELGKIVDLEATPVILPWRAALAFLPSFASNGTKKFVHCGMKRDENEPHLTANIYLDFNQEAVAGRKDAVVIADIMLATGGSFKTAIEMAERYGVKQNEIILVSLISVPEGIYNLLNFAPEITIITGKIDRCLNGLGYIQPGLGDAGDKFFDRLTIDYFGECREHFSDSQWNLLLKKIHEAN